MRNVVEIRKSQAMNAVQEEYSELLQAIQWALERNVRVPYTTWAGFRWVLNIGEYVLYWFSKPDDVVVFGATQDGVYR